MYPHCRRQVSRHPTFEQLPMPSRTAQTPMRVVAEDVRHDPQQHFTRLRTQQHSHLDKTPSSKCAREREKVLVQRV